MAVSLRVRAIAERERRRRQRTKQDEGIQFPAPQPGAQELFLNTTAEIAVYGGAAGGGKTFALLMDTAKEELIEHPAYNAVIFRRSYPQIMNPGGLWDESATMYPLINGSPKQSAVEWSFPSGAKIAFRHLGHETTKYQWQGSQFPSLCFDELTHFSESQFWYMVSRNRSPAGIPTKIRATTNPDADSWVADFIDWWIGDDGFPIPERGGVVRWFVRDGGDTIWADDPDDLLAQYPTQQPKSFTFIPANIQDNPILLEKDPTYLGNLQAQHPVERARLLEGNWKARFDSGTVFDRTWFTVIDPVYAKIGRVVRFWDIAATAAEMARSTTYYTAGVKMTKYGDIYTVLDVTARQVGAGNVEAYIMAIAQQDGKDVKIRWEREGGSSGILWGEQLKKRLQALGYDADYISPLGDKVTRATPYATDASNGKVFVTRKDWTDEYLGCLQRFDGSPQPLVNDYTDASSGAHQYLDSSGILVAPNIKEAANSNRKLKAVWD